MAYNASQGPRELGDIKNEDDPDTQVDFGSDQIALKTGGVDRVTVTNNHVSCSVNHSASAYYGNGANLTNVPVSPAGANTQIQFNDGGSAMGASANLTFSSNTLSVVGQISASLGVTGSRLQTPTTIIDDLHLSSSVNISGAAFYGDEVYVGSHIYHNGDVDTYINLTPDDINFQVGGVNFLDLTEDDSQDEVTFNEGGVDIDFRVESANDTHILFVDGANDAVSIGVSTDAPSAVLEVSGDAAQGKATLTVVHAEDTNNAVNITADSLTTAKALRISADALTTGNALYIDDDSSNTGTRNTAIVIQNNAAAIGATALAVQSDGGVTGVTLDKNYSDTAEASVVGINIDFDKTGASTSDNNMYGIQLDMDNTTATNGNNTMYGLHVTPTLTHAADAGTPNVKGAVISATGGTNGTSTATGMELTATGADTNSGLIINCADGGTDLRIVSSADTGDYFQVQTIAAGATTITTVDDNATAAHLTCSIDGDIVLDPALGNVKVDGNLSASINISASAFYGDAQFMSNLPNVPVTSYNNAGANRVVTSTGAGGIEGEVAMTFNGSILSVTGQISASLGVTGSRLQTPTTLIDDLHVSSSLNVSGAAFYGDGSNLTNVPASPAGSNFNVQFNDDGDLGGSNNFIFDGAKVGVGGHLSASLGITGSALEIDNNAIISGSLRTKQIFTTYSAWNSSSSSKYFVPFYNVTETSVANNQTILVKPLSGRLVAAIWRPQLSQGGNNCTLALHVSGSNSEAPDTSYNSETVTIPQDGTHTPVTFILTGSQHFVAGQVVAISIDPHANAGEQNLTCLWEYDVFGMGV